MSDDTATAERLTSRTDELAHNIAHLSYEDQAEKFCDLADHLEREVEQQALTIAELREQLQTAQYNADCAEFAAKREGNTRLAEQAARLREAGQFLNERGYHNEANACYAAIDGAKT